MHCATVDAMVLAYLEDLQYRMIIEDDNQHITERYLMCRERLVEQVVEFQRRGIQFVNLEELCRLIGPLAGGHVSDGKGACGGHEYTIWEQLTHWSWNPNDYWGVHHKDCFPSWADVDTGVYSFKACDKTEDVASGLS
jgi:hypothetical protein